MLRWKQSTPPCAASDAGFTSLELLLGVVLMTLTIAATSGMYLASKGHMRMQALEIETTQAGRSALDMMVRDLRLGGACLPVTGEFISLDGVDNGDEDEIITRTGLTRADLSCIRSATTTDTPASGASIGIASTDGFEPGMRAYIRHPNGSGEYFDITSVNSGTELGRATAFSLDYPPTSGVYAIDERRFFIHWFTSPNGALLPELMLQEGGDPPQSFAVGIERLAIRYELRSNCTPDCEVVDLPADNAEWSIVEQVLLELTARSQTANSSGDYYRRTLVVSVKPRNILPQ
jgi:type II secretory pathway pseudopilin PulG